MLRPNQVDDLRAIEQSPIKDTLFLIAGRGYGKTMMQIFWLCNKGLLSPHQNLAYVSAHHVTDIVDDVFRFSKALFPDAAITYSQSKRCFQLGDGSRLAVFNEQNPDRLRGGEWHYIAFDEVNAWRRAAQYDNAWDTGMIGLRLGEKPMAFVTASPVTTPLTLRIKADRRTLVMDKTDIQSPNLTTSIKRAVNQRLFGGKSQWR